MAIEKRREPTQRVHVSGESTEFVDPDYSPEGHRAEKAAPTRQQLNDQLTAKQQELTRLTQTHEEIERQIQALEERRRRRADFSHGLDEMRQNLARAIGLLEKAELAAKRESERLGQSLTGLRAAEASLEPLDETAWTASNWEVELNRGLTVVETARLEYHAACQKFAVLDGSGGTPGGAVEVDAPFSRWPTMALLRLGFALTWPLAVAAILGVGLLAVLAFRK